MKYTKHTCTCRLLTTNAGLCHNCANKINVTGILVETGYVSSMGDGLVAMVDVDTEKDAYGIVTAVHVLLCLFL